MLTIKDIPKRKPKDYPENFRKWKWIGDVIRIHCRSKRVWGQRIETWACRTKKGQDIAWNRLKKRFPYAFTKDA